MAKWFKTSLYYLSLLLGTAIASFLLFHILPADPARVALGPYASQQSVDSLRHELGLDLPPAQQFLHQMRSLAKGDLGKSFVDGRSVATMVLERFRTTASIGLTATMLAFLVSFLVNAAADRWPNWGWLIESGRFASHFPSFVLAILGALAVSAVFPAVSLGGAGFFSSMMLAAVLAAVHPAAFMSMHLRKQIQSQRLAPHYRAARASGQTGWQLFRRHLLRPSSVAWLAALVNQLGILFFTVILIELTFSIPGVGTLLLQSIQRSDFPTLQGLILVNASLFVFLAIMAEVVYELVDPRLR